MLVAAVIVPTVIFAWGPDRQTFTEAHPAPYITFNSITDNSAYGDERNFVTVKDASNASDGGWKDTLTVQPGKEYVVRMYVHNNAASNLNLVATNVRASASVPTTTGKSVPISGFVTADNAKPAKVYDDVTLTSDQAFNLAYIPGSASYHNNSVGKSANGAKLGDSIVTSAGALLGYDKLDGKIPGCYQYSGYVYFKVKPQFATKNTFDMNKQVRVKGDSTWHQSVTTKPGDTVEYQISYKNTGDQRQNNVTVKDTLPTGISYIKDSTYVKNGTNPNGVKVGDALTTSGINIGDYNAAAAGYIKFSAKVASNDQLPKCGTNTLTNKAVVIVNGGSKDDTADVIVPKECQPTPPKEQPEYACVSLTATKISRTTYSFTGKGTAKNGAEIVNYTLAYGDGNSKTVSTVNALTHTYDEARTYTATLSVNVKVNGATKTVTSADCKVQVPVVPVTPQECKPGIPVGDARCEEKCTVPGKETLPKDSPDCRENCPVPGKETLPKDSDKCYENCTIPGKEELPKDSDKCVETPKTPETPTTPETPATPEIPAELPQTGAVNALLAVIGSGSLIAATIYYFVSRRAL
jgi:uncharacterized repeat protein (TIGR01451 family)/LPXTG-motif cell wall-anchored protein